MRLHLLPRFLGTAVLPLTLFVACGDDGDAKPDAGPRVDAPKGADAGVDSPTGDIDAPIDSPPSGGATRVWAVGDIATNNALIAVSFDDTTTLPVDIATAPKLPAMGELFDGTGTTAQIFDANGGKVAFVADATMAGRFDLYVANADGSSPALLVEGQANIEITAVALSPDGTKVAFTMDTAAINGGYDLYMVATTNPQAPAKLSPNRPVLELVPGNLDVFNIFTWSADSKYIAFSADLTNDTYDQAYVVDTTVAAPAAVELLTRAEIADQAMGAKGVRGALQFDSANNIYFRARIVANNTQFQLFKAAATGAASRTALTLPNRGDASTPDVGAFGLSPDGSTIVVSIDAPTATGYNLYKSAVATFAPTAITALAGPGKSNFTSPLWFSPDGTKVAAVGDYLTAGTANVRNEPYVIALDGSTMTPRRLVKVADACGACDASVVQWAADNQTVFIQGDPTTNNDSEFYKASSAMTEQTPTLAVDLVMDGDAVNLFARPI